MKIKITDVLSWLGLIGVFAAIYGAYYWQSSGMKAVKENGLRTIGVIESYGGSVICRYQIDCTRYEFKRSQPFTGLQDDEMYEVAYMPNDEEDAVIAYENPILPDSILFVETDAIEMKLQKLNKNRLNFKYSADGKSYERTQMFIVGKVDENKTYTVKYNPKNPRIAYLIID